MKKKTKRPLSNQGLLAQLEAIERELIEEALRNAQGNMAQAARLLKLTERKIGLRVSKYNIDWRAIRKSSQEA